MTSKAQGAHAGGRPRRRLRRRRCYAMNTDPQPAHRPGDPAGSRGHRHQGGDQGAGAGRSDRRRRRQGPVAPMIWSGGMGWIADFPDPSDFYGADPRLRRRGARAAGTGRGTATRASRTRATKADAMSSPRRRTSATRSGRGSSPTSDEQAPWAPVFNEQPRRRPSKRMGGPDDLHRSDPRHRLRGGLHQAVSDKLAFAQTRRFVTQASSLSFRPDRHHSKHGALQSHHPSPTSPFRLEPRFRPVADVRRPARRSISSAWMPPAASSTPDCDASPTSRRSISAKVNPVTGPVYVDGAEPGDALKITFRKFIPSGCRLDREHPRLRPARRPVHGARAPSVDL